MVQIATLIPLVVGITGTLFTIVIHSLALTGVIRFVRRCRRIGRTAPRSGGPNAQSRDSKGI
jgi:hypothetical protein